MVINDKEHYNRIRETISMDNMRKLLDSKDYSVTKLATRAGISGSTVNAYLNGQKIPSLTTLVSMANYLNCNTDFLIGRTNIPLRLEDVDAWDGDTNMIIHSVMNLDENKKSLVMAYIKGLIDSDNE